MKSIIRLACAMLCASTMINNLHADLTARKGTEFDWKEVTNTAIKMYTEFMEELGQQIPSNHLDSLMVARHVSVFEKKELELFVLTTERYNNQSDQSEWYSSEQFVGYVMFRINGDAIYLGGCAYNEELTDDESVKKSFNLYLLKNYPQVKFVYSADMFPNHNGPVMTKYRNRWNNLGFVKTDSPDAKLCAADESRRAGAQGYVLSLNTPVPL